MKNNIPSFEGLNVTFCTNFDCNLACKYCYEINKESKILSREKATAFIDKLLDDPDPAGVEGTESYWINQTGIILDFIGGDSFMHPDLIDYILTYFTVQATLKNSRWANNWRASISTNGTLFSNPEVRKLIRKWGNNMSIGISIDGCKEIHDANRIFAIPNKDGSERGTMDEIIKWRSWIKEQSEYSVIQTKSTCAKSSIPYLFKSLVYMHEVLGISYINQNFIMEDTGCTEEDYIILDREFEKCVRYVLDHRKELYWSMIEFNTTNRVSNNYSAHDESLDKGLCGSGSMPTLSIDGEIYPCFRWLPHTQKDLSLSKNFLVGTAEEGFFDKSSFDRVREATKRNISSHYCLDCECEPGCPYCVAGCFSEFGEFKRTEFICKISKIRNKWARFYWSVIEKENRNEGNYF